MALETNLRQILRLSFERYRVFGHAFVLRHGRAGVAVVVSAFAVVKTSDSVLGGIARASKVGFQICFDRPDRVIFG